MVYQICSCDRTCTHPKGCNQNCTLIPTCKCPEGFLMNNDDCVPEEQCGCFIDGEGVVPKDGQVHMGSNCSTYCECRDGTLNCNFDYACGSNTTCHLVDGIMGCYCQVENENASSPCEMFADCKDVYETGHTEDGIYTVLPRGWGGDPFNVLCNMTVGGGGWTVSC
ncbi:IgGFc-binding protein [Holothuria leucospilota]|uniref:IgGFc-binding protein n=1 Tax=Holothuria leucospilota TaxID=206669 RepID=A0A9Q1BVZ6_HOLLE|nr:IgGFc-binding protein [Holothuria leucospilota]